MRIVEIVPENAEAFAPYIAASEYPRACEPGAVALGLADGTFACGAALLRPLPDGGWELSSLCLDPGVRGRGEGGRLLEAAVAAAREQGARELYAAFAFSDNRPMAAFLQKHGFGPPRRAAVHYSFPLSAAARLRLYGPDRPSPEIRPLLEAPEGALGRFLAQSRGELPENLALERYLSALEPDLSLAWLDGERLGGYLILCLRQEGLYLAAAYLLPECRGSLLPLLREARRRALGGLPPETPVRFCAVTERAEYLADRLTNPLSPERREEWHQWRGL